MKGKQLWRK